MPKTVIHVNQHVIRRNKKLGTTDPCITVKASKQNRYTGEAQIVDKNGNVVAKIVYRPNKPLSCGAVCWVETDLEVLC